MIERLGVNLNILKELPIIGLFKVNGLAVLKRPLLVLFRVQTVDEVEIVTRET